MMKIVNIILRLALGGVFIFAAVVKIANPMQFAGDVGNYRMVPHEWLNLFAIVLPWIEAAVGLLLVLGIWRRSSALVITVLLVVFLIAIGQAVARGLNINCGCFGTVEGRKVGLIALVQDMAMLAAAVWLVWRDKDQKETPA